jgi:hypothetical protein
MELRLQDFNEGLGIGDHGYCRAFFPATYTWQQRDFMCHPFTGKNKFSIHIDISTVGQMHAATKFIGAILSAVDKDPCTSENERLMTSTEHRPRNLQLNDYLIIWIGIRLDIDVQLCQSAE